MLDAAPSLIIHCGACLLWWLLFPGQIALALGIWWVSGFLWALARYVVRNWALKEAVLKAKDYKLFGRRTGRSSKRLKHDRAALYELPVESAFPPGTIMTLVSFDPRIYVSHRV